MKLNVQPRKRAAAPLLHLFALLCCLLLLSCGSSGKTNNTGTTTGTTTTTGGTTTTTTTPTTVTISVSLRSLATNAPIVGALVMLDGTTSTAVSNTSGIALFYNASNAAHNIHVFANGYQWESIYQTSNRNLGLWLKAVTTSYLYFQFTGISNLTVGNSVALTLENPVTGEVFDGQLCSATTNICQITLSDVAANQTLNLNLYAIERNPQGTSVDMVPVAMGASYTTQAVGSLALVMNAPLSLNAAKLPTISLLNISTVTPPATVGLVSSVQALMRSPFGITIDQTTSAPVLLSGYYAFSGVTTGWGSYVWGYADARSGAGRVIWRKTQRSALTPATPMTIAITHAITAAPVITTQNAAAATPYTINFTKATGSFSLHRLMISDLTGQVLWNLYVPNTATSVTLPALPIGPSPVVLTGNNYTMTLAAVAIDGLSYDAAITSLTADPLLFTSIESSFADPLATLTR